VDFINYLFPFSDKLGNTAVLLKLILACPQWVTAYAEAAQTPSHSRIIYLEKKRRNIELLLELPISPQLISPPVPSASRPTG